jgi:hypothetical protein
LEFRHQSREKYQFILLSEIGTLIMSEDEKLLPNRSFQPLRWLLLRNSSRRLSWAVTRISYWLAIQLPIFVSVASN